MVDGARASNSGASMNAISSLRQAVRDELDARPGIWGLTIAALAVIVVLRGVFWVVEPTGPTTLALGIVERIYVASESKYGSQLGAVVRLTTGAPVNVQLGSTLPCNVGDVIHLVRKPTHFGVTYVVNFPACSLRPAPSPENTSAPNAPTFNPATTSPPARPSLIPS
jgi:hypothetical protein